MELEDFSGRVARHLTSLTFLTLAENDFTRLPGAMSSLTNLSVLSLTHTPLQFDMRAFNTLASMSNLICISLAQENTREPIWSPESAAVMMCIAKDNPDLHVEVLRDAGKLIRGLAP